MPDAAMRRPGNCDGHAEAVVGGGTRRKKRGEQVGVRLQGVVVLVGGFFLGMGSPRLRGGGFEELRSIVVAFEVLRGVLVVEIAEFVAGDVEGVSGEVALIVESRAVGGGEEFSHHGVQGIEPTVGRGVAVGAAPEVVDGGSVVEWIGHEGDLRDQA